MLLQNTMFVVVIATLVQLYPIALPGTGLRIGTRLPITMGVSFIFITILCSIAVKFGYPAVIGAVLIGGLFEGFLGLFAKYLAKFIKPIVAASIVTSIGMSLLAVGVRSFGGGYAEDFGSATNLFIGTFTLIVCFVCSATVKGYLKQLSVLAGL